MKRVKVWKLEVCPICLSDEWIYVHYENKINCSNCKKESSGAKEITVTEVR